MSRRPNDIVRLGAVARRKLAAGADVIFRRLHGQGPERPLVEVGFLGTEGVIIITPWLGARLAPDRPGLDVGAWTPDGRTVAAAPPDHVRDAMTLMAEIPAGGRSVMPPPPEGRWTDEDPDVRDVAGLPVDADVWRTFARTFLAGSWDETAHAAGRAVLITLPFGRGYVMTRREE